MDLLRHRPNPANRPKPFPKWWFYSKYLMIPAWFVSAVMSICGLFQIIQMTSIVNDPDHEYLREVTYHGEVMGQVRGTYWGYLVSRPGDYQPGTGCLIVLMVVWQTCICVGSWKVWKVLQKNHSHLETYRDQWNRENYYWLIPLSMSILIPTLIFLMAGPGDDAYLPIIKDIQHLENSNWTRWGAHHTGDSGCPKETMAAYLITSEEERYPGCRYEGEGDEIVNLCCFEMGHFLKSWPEAKETWLDLKDQMFIRVLVWGIFWYVTGIWAWVNNKVVNDLMEDFDLHLKWKIQHPNCPTAQITDPDSNLNLNGRPNSQTTLSTTSNPNRPEEQV